MNRTIRITRNGFLANLPVSGPNRAKAEQIRAIVFSPETVKRWAIKIDGEHGKWS